MNDVQDKMIGRVILQALLPIYSGLNKGSIIFRDMSIPEGRESPGVFYLLKLLPFSFLPAAFFGNTTLS